mgnify:CR=1 FL=1
MAASSSQLRSDATADAGLLPVLSSKDGAITRVPETRPLRDRIRAAVDEWISRIDRTRPLSRYELENAARSLLAQLGLPSAFAGWTMVAIASRFWAEQVESVPVRRRLLLLPHCLRKAETCPAAFDHLGLVCRHCGACDLHHLAQRAESLGYRVMIAEGSPVVLKTILSGHVDAVLGVACLETLERTFDKILLAGIPCMAVPLVEAGCRNTSADADQITEMIDRPYRPQTQATRTYLHLMRLAARMFDAEQLREMTSLLAESAQLPRPRPEPAGIDSGDVAPIVGLLDGTEALALDFLRAGGKHSRPFITLAVYDAMLGGKATGPEGAAVAAAMPAHVRRIALAIEVFHKASLVHDDVEDDDLVRYGQPTIHHRFGPAVAINVGDFLIGLGYRLIGHPSADVPAESAADLLRLFSSAHMQLSQGQGAELIWRDGADKHLEPFDALRIYALKTAPAFEAAILAGTRLAGPIDSGLKEAVERYSRHLGVAFQILNDLDDWSEDSLRQAGPPDITDAATRAEGAAPIVQEGAPRAKRGSDVLAGRPTILWALAWQRLSSAERRWLSESPAAESRSAWLAQAAECFSRTGAFERAASLVVKHHRRAIEAADGMEPEPLRFFLRFLADAILDRRPLSINDHG